MSIQSQLFSEDSQCFRYRNLKKTTEITICMSLQKLEDIQCIPIGITVKTEQKQSQLQFVVEFLLIQTTERIITRSHGSVRVL